MTVRRPQSSYNKNGAASLLILKLIWFTGLSVFINKFLMPSYFDLHVSFYHTTRFVLYKLKDKVDPQLKALGPLCNKEKV
jgi:hypothetical protein